MKRIATNYGAFKLFKRTLILPIRLAIFSGMLLPFSRISSTPSKLWTLIWRKLLILLPRVIVVWSFCWFPFLKHFPKQLISVTLQQKLFVNVERLINYASRPFDKINKPSRPMVISDQFIIPQKCWKSKLLTQMISRKNSDGENRTKWVRVCMLWRQLMLQAVQLTFSWKYTKGKA